MKPTVAVNHNDFRFSNKQGRHLLCRIHRIRHRHCRVSRQGCAVESIRFFLTVSIVFLARVTGVIQVRSRHIQFMILEVLTQQAAVCSNQSGLPDDTNPSFPSFLSAMVDWCLAVQVMRSRRRVIPSTLGRVLPRAAVQREFLWSLNATNHHFKLN